MAEYLIAFNDEWVPDHTEEEIREKSRALRPLLAEMRAAGIMIFTGGLDDRAPVFRVNTASGTPAVHGWSLRRDQGAPRRLCRHRCGRRGQGASMGQDRGRLRLAAGGSALPDPHAAYGCP